MADDPAFARLSALARDLRCDIIRMITAAGSGHPGGSLSAVEVIAYLYFHKMKVDPQRPDWEDRDRFVLSKGHCCPVLYAALARRGYFPPDTLWTLRDLASPLQGHPDMRKTPGVDMTTGSLGQGFSAAVGMAMGGKVQQKDFRVYLMLGDGEIQAGVVWEAAMAAAHYRLDNLSAIVDNNRLQTDGETASIMTVEPVEEKFRAFGWETVRIDGHDFARIHEAFETVSRAGRPGVIVADTVKGKGVAEMENNHVWHAGAPSEEQARRFLAELEEVA
jgi:transketolase